MDALKERRLYKSWDKSFRFRILLQKHNYLNLLVNRTINTFCLIVRKFLSSNKNSGIILIVAIHRLGDTVFTIPAIQQIYNYYKNYKKFIVCFEDTSDILLTKFPSDDIISLSKNDFIFKRRLAKNNIRDKVKSLNPEIIFDLTGQITSASIIFNSSAHTIIGTNFPYLKNIYNHFVELRTKPTYMDSYLDIVRLVIPQQDSLNIKLFTSDFNKNGIILIHPFAIRKSKEWNLKRFIDLAVSLSKKFKVEIVCPKGFISSEILMEIRNNQIPYTETHTIKELINKINECSLFISNDSGPIYIAGLLGKATFTIYGPTNPAYSLLHGHNHKHIQLKLNCSSPLHERFCFTSGGIYCPSMECIELISLKAVTNDVNNFAINLGIERISKNDDSN